MKNKLNYEKLHLHIIIQERFKKSRSTMIAIVLVLMTMSTLVGCGEDDVEDSKENINEDALVNVEANEGEDSKADKEDKSEGIDEENKSEDEAVDSDEVADTDEALNENNDPFKGYKRIEVEGGNQSGNREPNVVVDIGFGDRKYYAYTNEHGQLVKVTASKIVLQDESTEPVLSTGRYYSDEAKVPGVESPVLDEGHVIADSLGGVANAYNITPQNSTLNRHGDQAYMEKVIRDADGCTDFVAIITYPDTETQIPSHYSYTYVIRGNTVKDEFDNVNPDEVNAKLETQASNQEPANQEPVNTSSNKLMITSLDKKAEYIIIKNSGNKTVDITNWKIVSVTGGQNFTFPKFALAPNASVKVGDSQKNPDVDFHWLDGRGTWNNTKSDPAELYDASGKLIYRYND